jgi:hypothetical protein
MKTTLTPRREFLKSSAIVSAALLTGSAIQGCGNQPQHEKNCYQLFPEINIPEHKTNAGPIGLLFSQMGYETGYPVRIIFRAPSVEILSGEVLCRLFAVTLEKEYQTRFSYWGEIWKSHWWVAEFSDISDEGEWRIEIVKGKQVIMRDTGLKTGKNILWEQTVELAAADMLERRVHFTKVGAGWQDAGTLWVESPAQSAMVLALEELLEFAPERISPELTERVQKQITVGCDYLVMLEKKARELGFPPGSTSHDLLGHEKDVLPNDAVKAAIALSRALRLLPESFATKKAEYKTTASVIYKWLTTQAKPVGDLGLSRFQRGLPEDGLIPHDEWQTRDLVSLLWASLEQWKINNSAAKERAVYYAREIMSRQIAKENSEAGYYGHFREYASTPNSEKSWIHGIVNNQFGADIGGIFPNYLLPLHEMIAIWPDHEDTIQWRETLRNFTYGYLIPSCEKNPFLLVPQGIFGDEGPIWFCGTFHGTNAIYGYTAALASELSKFFDEPKLKNIAYSNLLWLAGLNAGITKENLAEGCVIYSADIPDGLALPVSQMCGVGNRWAGTWFQTRGVICNGFTTGKQFVYDVEPKKVNDGPFSFTDEDWIPHSAAWLTGLIRI